MSDGSKINIKQQQQQQQWSSVGPGGVFLSAGNLSEMNTY